MTPFLNPFIPNDTLQNGAPRVTLKNFFWAHLVRTEWLIIFFRANFPFQIPHSETSKIFSELISHCFQKPHVHLQKGVGPWVIDYYFPSKLFKFIPPPVTSKFLGKTPHITAAQRWLKFVASQTIWRPRSFNEFLLFSHNF